MHCCFDHTQVASSLHIHGNMMACSAHACTMHCLTVASLSGCTCTKIMVVVCRLQHHAQHRHCQTSHPRPLPTSCGPLPSWHTAQALSCWMLCLRMSTAAWTISALSTLLSPCGLLESWKHLLVLFCCRSVAPLPSGLLQVWSYPVIQDSVMHHSSDPLVHLPFLFH